MAKSKELAQEGATRIRDALVKKGLRVHPVTTDVDEAEFLGLRFNLKEHVVAVKPSKVVRLRYALLEVLRRGALSPVLMEVILGHCTW